jgi:hypothetical protein
LNNIHETYRTKIFLVKHINIPKGLVFHLPNFFDLTK